MVGADGARDRKGELRSLLTRAQEELLAQLERVQTDQWTRVSANDGWYLRELLAHLATAEVGFLATIRRMAAGEGGVAAEFDVDRWNAAQVRRTQEATPEQLRETLQSNHQQMLALLNDLDDAALDRRGRMSIGEEGSVADTMRLLARHKGEHTAHLAAALDRPGL